MELVWLFEKRGAGEQFHRNQAMIAHNWMAGALFQACHASCQPGPPPPQHQRQCRHWRHHQPDAQQLPCANLQHQQSGATPPKLPQPGRNLTSVGPRGGAWRPLKSTPGWQGGLSANMRIWRCATLRPMAARPCSPAPALGNVLVMPISGRHTQRRG